MEENNNNIKREFGLSTLSINNRTSVFILIFIIVGFGLISYINMPKEQFPEVVIPTVYVNTIYPGNSPVDIENLITRPIEKELKSIKGVKKINSTSAQDVSSIIIEFNENIKISKALQDTKDAVDKSKRELPNDLDQDPTVLEVDLSEIPIVMINLSGDFEIDQLKKFAEYLEDEIETLAEVSKVNIIGALDREIQINADMFKMEARRVTFSDIEQAIASENITTAGGEVLTDGYRRSLRISGEFKRPEELRNVIVKSEGQDVVYLKDVADVVDSYVERKSFARLATGNFASEGNFPVVSLQVVKRNGENLINADEKIVAMLAKAKAEVLPANLNIVLTDNQADNMKNQVSNLENSIISGVILVVLVLLFFMGLRNALFVGVAIPLSMFLSFIILSAIGITVNIVVLFGLILALGMLVDNAIVVIENTYRLMENGYSPLQAAKEGVGEVAIAIISSTATTLAAFLPLVFWSGILGEFMKYLPITLIVVLSSSLFVGLVINPVIAASFMKVDKVKRDQRRLTIFAAISIALAIPSYFIFSTYSIANLLMVLGGITLTNVYLLRPASHWFQSVLLTRIEVLYRRTLSYALCGVKPYLLLFSMFVLMIVSVQLFFVNSPQVTLFPSSDPDYIYMYMEAPLGSDVKTTDAYTRQLEQKVFESLKPYANIVKSIVTNVGEGTSNPMEGPATGNVTPHKSRISIGFVDYEDREGVSTAALMKNLSEMAKTLPGLKITTDKPSNGPPVGAPINIEVTGDDYITLINEAEKIKAIIEQARIPGIDGLKLGLEIGKPEVLLDIDREKARRLGLSTSSLAMSMRTAIYGKEVSKFKEGEDDFPIQLRLKNEQRYNLSTLKEQKISFRDNKGTFHQIPISAVANLEYTSSFGSVKRKNSDRMITVVSNVTEGYNSNKVVQQVKTALASHQMPAGYNFKFTGEQEEQAESMAFLSRALLIAVTCIFMILVSQFNSVVKPFIIMISVLLSTIGVFLGLYIFNDDFVIIMTGVGIISLAGVVVNNAIVLIDCIDLIRARVRKEKGLSEDERLSKEDLVACLVEGGYTRLRPVLLTAITTVLGLIPLATGLNIDFFGLFASFEPSIYSGGRNADFWGPMAWTVIYGLSFATFLTLVIVPVMYLIADRISYHTLRISGKL